MEALETMKSVATKINDTQRQFESLQEIIRFQNSIDGWEVRAVLMIYRAMNENLPVDMFGSIAEIVTKMMIFIRALTLLIVIPSSFGKEN